ncbi:restriction endonuclease [Helicobacter labacensis]|uniref:restriction endonuclease n=1 Tax=Helicobacter labacensis TaxID=2316079 RepID=UPI000EB51B4D|nr:restriction endonuclease [Helicobacter labacensis]
MEQGREYEKFVAQGYVKRGYDCDFHCDLGKQDQKIDLILTKDEEVLFIQCKNWNEKTPYRVGLDYVQEFLRNCDALEKAEYPGKNCQRLLALSADVLNPEAKAFLEKRRCDQRVGWAILPIQRS